jgi:hypothetical protein
MLGQMAGCNGLHSVLERCARWLLMTQDRVTRPDFPMTHEFLAAMLGSRRSSVTVGAATLQGAGYIRYAHGQMTILDRAGSKRRRVSAIRSRMSSSTAYGSCARRPRSHSAVEIQSWRPRLEQLGDHLPVMRFARVADEAAQGIAERQTRRLLLFHQRLQRRLAHDSCARTNKSGVRIVKADRVANPLARRCARACESCAWRSQRGSEELLSPGLRCRHRTVRRARRPDVVK